MNLSCKFIPFTSKIENDIHFLNLIDVPTFYKLNDRKKYKDFYFPLTFLFLFFRLFVRLQTIVNRTTFDIIK